MKENSKQTKKVRTGGVRSWTEHKKRPPGRHKRAKIQKMSPMDVEVMHVELLTPIILRAAELSRRGMYLHEIASTLATEFGINPPSEATIYRWRADVHKAYMVDIKEYRRQEVCTLLQQQDAILRKFLPIALASQQPVKRRKMVDGEQVEIIDEDGFEEQRKAAEIVIKSHGIRAEILGLKNGAGIEVTQDGEQTQASLFAFVGRMAAEAIAHREGKTISPYPQLELRSGVEHLYNTNEQPK